jgi:hypothetical protein
MQDIFIHLAGLSAGDAEDDVGDDMPQRTLRSSSSLFESRSMPLSLVENTEFELSTSARRMQDFLGSDFNVNEIHQCIRAFDSTDRGSFSKDDILHFLSSKKIRSRKENRLLVQIVERYNQMIQLDRLVDVLSTSLYSLFLFSCRNSFIRGLRFGRFHYGKLYLRLLNVTPSHSTVAHISLMQGVLQKADKINKDGPTEFAALWLDCKAMDKQRMIVLGFLELIAKFVPNVQPTLADQQPIAKLIPAARTNSANKAAARVEAKEFGGSPSCCAASAAC